MSATSVRLVVVIPVGPSCRTEFVGDTLESIEYFTTPDRVVVLLDDSHNDTCSRVLLDHSDALVWPTQQSSGRFGRLYRNLAQAFSRVLDSYSFEALLRIDTDALVIGEHPEEDAIACFRANPLVASAGNYRCEYGGVPRDHSWPVEQILKQTMTLRSLTRRPVSGIALRSLLRHAVANGYVPGDDVFGGACFYSEAGLRSLQRRNWLPHRTISGAYLEEDHMFGLTLRGCGFEFVDLWETSKSFACSWGRLPAPPDELAASTAKVTHSVRSFEGLDEAAVRSIFRSYRKGAVATTG